MFYSITWPVGFVFFRKFKALLHAITWIFLYRKIKQSVINLKIQDVAICWLRLSYVQDVNISMCQVCVEFLLTEMHWYGNDIEYGAETRGCKLANLQSGCGLLTLFQNWRNQQLKAAQRNLRKKKTPQKVLYFRSSVVYFTTVIPK